MERIPKSQVLRKALQEIVTGAVMEGNPMDEFFKIAMALVAQEFLEQEVTDFLGRGHYERSEDGTHGYRNGYEPRSLKTAEGKTTVFVPQVRGTDVPFRTKLGAFLKGNGCVLKKLVLEMYARGLSTRDIEDALFEATGDEVLSKTAVSEVTEILNGEFEAFQNRDLSSFQVEYLFLDAVYESIQRLTGLDRGILCAWGILRDGRKVLIHLAVGNKESYQDWLSFIRDMVKRGLCIPTTITSDGAPGLIKAIEAAFALSLRIRCWFHKMRNLMEKVPSEAWPEVKAGLIGIREAKDYQTGLMLSQEFVAKYRDLFPRMVACFQDDLEASLNHLKAPYSHRKHIRTTNLIERSFVEEKRRTKVIPGFFTEKSALKLVFSVLIRAAKRWRKITFTKVELAQLDRLRDELGIIGLEEEVNGMVV